MNYTSWFQRAAKNYEMLQRTEPRPDNINERRELYRTISRNLQFVRKDVDARALQANGRIGIAVRDNAQTILDDIDRLLSVARFCSELQPGPVPPFTPVHDEYVALAERVNLFMRL